MRFALLALVAMAAGAEPVAGLWDAAVVVNEIEIPFRIEFAGEGEALRGWFFNGEDKVTSTRGRSDGERVTLDLDHYATRLEAKLRDGMLEGTYGRPGRIYPFRARRARTVAGDECPAPRIDGHWEIAVQSTKGEAAWRMLVRQDGTEVSASILRVDGDTGSLAGRWREGKFVLSHFSGARPALVTLQPQADGGLSVNIAGKGTYRAVRPAAAREQGLATYTDPARHSGVKNPAEPLRFVFRDLDGRLISEEALRGRVVLVNVMGSWCPNCHDEAPFLAELHRRYRDQGLSIVALAFEEPEQLADPARLRAFRKEYGIEYPVLLAGAPAEVGEKLPQAVNLNSWPTTFFLGRDGRVRHVHAGFAGKSSGPLHDELKQEFAATVESLLGSIGSN